MKATMINYTTRNVALVVLIPLMASDIMCQKNEFLYIISRSGSTRFRNK